MPHPLPAPATTHVARPGPVCRDRATRPGPATQSLPPFPKPSSRMGYMGRAQACASSAAAPATAGPPPPLVPFHSPVRRAPMRGFRAQRVARTRPCTASAPPAPRGGGGGQGWVTGTGEGGWGGGRSKSRCSLAVEGSLGRRRAAAIRRVGRRAKASSHQLPLLPRSWHRGCAAASRPSPAQRGAIVNIHSASGLYPSYARRSLCLPTTHGVARPRPRAVPARTREHAQLPPKPLLPKPVLPVPLRSPGRRALI